MTPGPHPGPTKRWCARPHHFWFSSNSNNINNNVQLTEILPSVPLAVDKAQVKFSSSSFSQNRLQQAVILTFKAFLIPSRGWMSSARYGLGSSRFSVPVEFLPGKMPVAKGGHTWGHQPMPYFAIPVHCSGMQGVTVYHTTTYYKTCHTILYQ